MNLLEWLNVIFSAMKIQKFLPGEKAICDNCDHRVINQFKMTHELAYIRVLEKHQSHK